MPIKVYKRPGSDNWHYRGTVAGRRLRGSCETADKERAQRFAARVEDRAWKRDFDGPGAVLTFAQAAIRYRAAGKPTRFLATVEDHWKDTLVKDITSGAVKQGAEKIFTGRSGATKNRQFIVPTQAVINYAAEAELCSHLRVKRFKVVKKEKTPATWEWISTFMDAAPPAIGALACFLFLTGARISEAIAVEWEDIDFGRMSAVIRQGKTGGDERMARLPQQLIVALASIPGERKGRVWPYESRKGPTYSWRTTIERAGLPYLSFHACRHGFATGLMHKGYDPITVAKKGGWKSAQHVFATYGHAMEDETVADVLVDTPQTQEATPKPRNVAGTNG